MYYSAMKSLMLLLAFALWKAESLKSTLNLAIKSSELSTIKDALVAEFLTKPKEITLPDFTSDFLFGSIAGKNVRVRIPSLRGSQISIALVEGTADILIEGKDIDLNGNMDLIGNLFFFTREWKASVKMASTAFTARARLSRNNERVQVALKEFSIISSRGNFSIEITGDFFDSILNMLLKIVHFIFFELVTDSVSSIVKGMTTKAIDEALKNYPNTVRLFPNVYAKFVVVSINAVKSGYLPISLYVYGYNKTIPKELSPSLPNRDAPCNKGFQLFLSDFVLRTILKASYEGGLLKFTQKMEFFTIAMEVGCEANTVPVLIMQGDIQVSEGAKCSLKMQSKQPQLNLTASFTADVSSKLKEHIENAKLHIVIEELKVGNLKVVEGEDIEEEKLMSMINSLISDFKREINRVIEKYGIDLPLIKHFDLSDIKERIVQNYIFVCGSLKPRKESTVFNELADNK
eukprot:TRINITY_DN4607_c0_g1_i3.p1 TRINITY_DN4607_c0_g1~~TRINITY_DN4607_c0_g1_i3.p1  ORF type:complete len:461 (+),score=65.80 TRINITY_DN4607_c0_g1_i3:119-1501(+)